MHFSLLFLSLLRVGNAILLPKPSGPYSTALRIEVITDKSRIDPYDPMKGHRQVLASIFWPVDSASCSNTVVHYMPPATAKACGQQVAQLGLSNDTFAALELEVCEVASSQKGSASRRKSFPVAVFSPGAGNSRLIYSLMARSLASFGSVVILVDHPYDALVVELPDGEIIEGGNIPDNANSNEQLGLVSTISRMSEQLEDLLKFHRSRQRTSRSPSRNFNAALFRKRSSKVFQAPSTTRRLLPLATPLVAPAQL